MGIQETTDEWYQVSNIDTIDSPALLVYVDRVKENIRLLKSMVRDTARLRPHVKTHKMAEVSQLLLEQGITQFKCATIAEAEMLGMVKAPDVLMAYQPFGPKLERLIKLIKAFPDTRYSCLVDNKNSAIAMDIAAGMNGLVLEVWIDINSGMNRSGISPAAAELLIDDLNTLNHVSLRGLHAYDGHIRDTDLNTRQQKSDTALGDVFRLKEQAKANYQLDLEIVAGGSPSFPTHAHRDKIICSPGTFVFWDWGYKHIVPDEPFDYAALVVTRVVSVIDDHTICVDLGHKSVAAENPFPRVHFLNAPGLTAISQSEEHLVLKTGDKSAFHVGDVLYGVPVHICPTVALYDKANVVENNEVTGTWKVIARDRTITI